MKTCTKCNQTKSLSDFSKNKKSKDGLQYACTSCFSLIGKQRYSQHKDKQKTKSRTYYKNNKERCLIATKNWQEANPDKVKDTVLKRDFGISLEQYNNLLKSQDSSCAICGVHNSNLRINLAVDHCHITGKIRGLLCDPCNRGIGMLKDDPKILDRASTYLRYNRG